MNEPNLVLTGMMGTGKSTTARIISKKLNREHVDTDAQLEKHFGKSISDIFESEGESSFRRAEFELCQKLSSRSGLVISTGGGSLLTQKALRLFDDAEVFCLDAGIQTTWERTKRNTRRPLLAYDPENTTESLRRIQDLFTERTAAYDRVFHHVKVDAVEKERVAEEIVNRFAFGKKHINERRFIRMPSLPAQAHVVQEGSASQIPQYLKWAGLHSSRVIIISDETIKSLYYDKISANISKSQLGCEWLLVQNGEQNKNLETVHTLYKELLKIKANRNDVIVAIGGGVVGDVAGFVAATYMRGLSLVQVPTTLLSMVDSSIGGKTGVDMEEGKNLIGAFKQPQLILVDPSFLDTLPKDEFAAGMAEAIKHAIIDDLHLFETLEAGAPLNRVELIKTATAVKIRLVEEDPFEEGRRALLNFGHTFGHAIEKASQYKMRHGFAVSIGMIMACELAYHLNLCDESLRQRVEKVLKRFDLPTSLSDLRANDILKAMQHDKKWSIEGKKFILPFKFGDIRNICVNDDVLIHRTIESLIER